MAWLKKGLIFKNKSLFEWDRSHAQVPVVDKVDKKILRVYYSSRDKEGRSFPSYIEVDAKNPEKVTYCHSKPLLKLGSYGSFDESGIMPTCMITKDGLKYLYYIGWALKKTVPYQNSIGLAISEDNGKSFFKFSDGPIISMNHIDPYFTGSFFVLRDGNIYRGYYLSCTGWKLFDKKLEPLYILKYAESYDGINWSRYNEIVLDLIKGEGGLARPSVIKEGNLYRMWYAKRKNQDYRNNIKNSYRIGYAESKDGKNWRRLDEKSGIDISKHGWDSQMITYPNVIRIGSLLVMFYNGNGFGQSGFGYATLED